MTIFLAIICGLNAGKWVAIPKEDFEFTLKYLATQRAEYEKRIAELEQQQINPDCGGLHVLKSDMDKYENRISELEAVNLGTVEIMKFQKERIQRLKEALENLLGIKEVDVELDCLCKREPSKHCAMHQIIQEAKKALEGKKEAGE
jgi:hypothetical protein